MVLANASMAQIGASAIGKSAVGVSTLAPALPGKTRMPACKMYNSCDIPECPVYIFTGSGDWRIPGNWANEQVPPEFLPGCYKIIINPIGSDPCVLTLPQGIAPGASLLVMPGKKLIIPGKVDNALR